MVQENTTAQITSGSRGLKVMAAIFVTSYAVLAGTVGFFVYERVRTSAGPTSRAFQKFKTWFQWLVSQSVL